MNPSLQIPDSSAKSFALEVVTKLREADFESVWAGGCVRDALLGGVPKDYDVATSAHPDDVIRLFGKRRTVSVGASFGVVIVLDAKDPHNQVEVATFRTDGRYSDGRRPDHVRYCSAEEDAQRRDFTVNGMFYDPVDRKVIDYVGGQRDLERGVIRAIGNATERFDEDKLRMLRAARFAARFGFSLEAATADAIRQRADDIHQVSVERIAQELRHMLSHPSRQTALDLLIDTTVFPAVFPAVSENTVHTAREIYPFLAEPTFEPALAILFYELLASEDQVQSRSAGVNAACRHFKLSNEETASICWLCESFDRCHHPSELALHELKPILADRRQHLLLDWIDASVRAGLRLPDDIRFLKQYIDQATPEQLKPAPLITGADLQVLGVPSGPAFSVILRTIRNEQLDELISSRDEALQRAQQLLS